MKILVTGADGMLGSDLCPILQDEGYEIVETSIKDFDISDYDKTKKFILEENPEIIIHTAGYTNVEKAEEEPNLVYKVNVCGTENIAKVASKINAVVVYISTDYVFDGLKKEPYLPSDKPSPLNIYGKTKYEGEEAVKKYCEKYYIIRTSWLFGHHGKNFVETMLSNAYKETISVVDDQIGCPTWTVDLADAIIDTINNGKYGIYHACNQGNVSWYEFAKEIFKIYNVKTNLIPCKTKDYPQKAKRPKNSTLGESIIAKNWKSALREYFALSFNYVNIYS